MRLNKALLTKIIYTKMKQLRPLLVVLFLSVLGYTSINAQQSINATGGEATGSGGNVSYSVGQVAYITSIGANGSVIQGVQQPFEISVITAKKEAQNIGLSVAAYPNPTVDFLTLELNVDNFQNLSYQLYGVSGKVLMNRIISDNKTRINMTGLEPQTYFVKVRNGNTELKTFKVIKVN